jgi:hypothetical protein
MRDHRQFSGISSGLHRDIAGKGFLSRMSFARKVWRRVAAVGVVIASVYLALLVWIAVWRFYPANRSELVSPGGENVRAFTEVEGFVDVSINLYASDWPHTFWMPARIGDLYWPESYSATAYWSGDGSVVATQFWWPTGPDRYFTGAYDFREHRLLERADMPGDPGEVDRRIARLIEERGGLGEAVPNAERKGDALDDAPFPRWGWIPPGVVAVLGLIGAASLWRR